MYLEIFGGDETNINRGDGKGKSKKIETKRPTDSTISLETMVVDEEEAMK